MKDQAQKLREIVGNMKKKNNIGVFSYVQTPSKEQGNSTKNARVIAITSGKGGVGKTNLTINLGLALNQLGYKVVILDADLGLANIDVIIGVIPQFTLAHVIRREKTLEEIIIDGPNGIQIISGGSGLKELVHLSEEQLVYLIDNLKEIGKDADFILIDTGAGINQSILSFVSAASEIILISTPEPTSITDAYAMIKNIVSEDKEKSIKVLINRASSSQEGVEIFDKLNAAAQKFLNVSLSRLGYLYEDPYVSKSVRFQTPFLLKYPSSLASQGVKAIAERLIDESKEEFHKNNGLQRFLHKIFSRYYLYRKK